MAVEDEAVDDGLLDAEDLVAGLIELDAASPGYRDAMEYYLGDVDERFASKRAARALESGDWYKVNAAKCPVDAVTDRLSISSVTALTGAGEKWPEADEALRKVVWDRNRLDQQFPRLIRDTGIYGDGYLYYWYDPEDLSRPVRVSYNSPLVMRVVYDPEDDLTPLYGVKRWKNHLDGTEHANLITDVDVVRYELDTSDPRKTWRDPEAWVEVARETHEFGRLPVGHSATWLPYGRPEHRDAYGPQNAISKLAPTMVDSAEQSGYPARYALASADASLRGDRPDTLDYDDDETQDMTSDESLQSKLKTGPGEIALLEGFTGAGQWAAASSSTFIDGANWFMRVMAQSTSTPLHMLDPGGSVPSGESRRIADAPLDSKVGLRKTVYGAVVAAVLVDCLEALGFAGVQVRVKWRPSPVADDTLTWQTARAKIDAGVPVRVALLETGLYDADEIDAWFDPDGRGQLDLMRQINALDQIGDVLVKLGQAKALLDIDGDLVERLTLRVLGQAAGEEPEVMAEALRRLEEAQDAREEEPEGVPGGAGGPGLGGGMRRGMPSGMPMGQGPMAGRGRMVRRGQPAPEGANA